MAEDPSGPYDWMSVGPFGPGPSPLQELLSGAVPTFAVQGLAPAVSSSMDPTGLAALQATQGAALPVAMSGVPGVLDYARSATIPAAYGGQSAADAQDIGLGRNLAFPQERTRVGGGVKVGAKGSEKIRGMGGGGGGLGGKPYRDLEAGYAAAQAATDREGQAMAEAAAASYDVMAKTNQKYAEQLAQEEQYRAKTAALAEQQQKQLEADLVSLGNMRIDPRRTLRQGGWGNLLRGLGILVSGLGARATGGKNLGIEILNKEIDDDIQAQRDELATKRSAIEGRFSLYKTNLDRWGNQAQAMASTRAAYLQLGQNQLAAEKAKFESPVVRARYDNAIAQLEIQKAQQFTAFAEAAKNRAEQAAGRAQAERHFERQMEFQERRYLAEGKMAAIKRLEDKKALSPVQASNGSGVPGAMVVAGDTKVKDALDEKAAMAEYTLRLIDQLNWLDKQGGKFIGNTRLPGDPILEQKRALVADFVDAIKNRSGPNALQAHEIDFYKGLVGGDNDIFDRTDRRLQTRGNIQSMMDSQYNNKLRYYDPETGKEWRPDKNQRIRWNYTPNDDPEFQQWQVSTLEQIQRKRTRPLLNQELPGQRVYEGLGEADLPAGMVSVPRGTAIGR